VENARISANRLRDRLQKCQAVADAAAKKQLAEAKRHEEQIARGPLHLVDFSVCHLFFIQYRKAVRSRPCDEVVKTRLERERLAALVQKRLQFFGDPKKCAHFFLEERALTQMLLERDTAVKNAAFITPSTDWADSAKRTKLDNEDAKVAPELRLAELAALRATQGRLKTIRRR